MNHKSASSIFVLLLLGLAVNSAKGTTLQGQVTFAKLPPQVALVWVKDGKTGPEKIEVDQKDKQFMTKLSLGKSGSEIVFKNTDDVEHNIFANDPGTGAKFDVGLLAPGKDSKIPLSWGEGKVVRVGCKIHPKMQTWVANIPSQSYSILEPKPGEKSLVFTVNNIPEGATEVNFWSPKHDAVTVKLAKGSEQKMELVSKGKPEGMVTVTLK